MKPVILSIQKIKQETRSIKTFSFDYDLKAEPGQFVMLWIPGVDQKPISVSSVKKNSFDLTVFKVGQATQALFKMKVGDKVGITGPYGKGFNIKPKSSIILVGGGCGSAPLKAVAEEAKRLKCKTIFITGARSSMDVLFGNEVKLAKCLTTTNDGSKGLKGHPTDQLEAILSRQEQIKGYSGKFYKVYTCGPELMMKGVVDICARYKIPCEISMERYMKCGYGVCGQCAVDPEGICICQEGPVFSGTMAKKITEFGKYHRDKAGIKHNF